MADKLAAALEAAEKAMEYLRVSARDMENLVLKAKDKARVAKYTHALAVVRMENANSEKKVPATVRKEHALADDEVQAALKEADAADAELISVDAKRDAAKTAISLYQTMVKDRL